MTGAIPGKQERLQERLDAYERLVLRWNRRIPLVSRRTPRESLRRLVEHSLAAEKMIPDSVITLFDVGSGAGLPGIPMALARPGLSVRLVERSNRKQLFLKEAIRTLGLERVELVAASFGPEMVKGERPLAITALGLGGYKEFAASLRSALEPGDGLLMFVGKGLAGEIAEAVGGGKFRWRLLEGSEKAGTAWIWVL